MGVGGVGLPSSSRDHLVGIYCVLGRRFGVSFTSGETIFQTQKLRLRCSLRNLPKGKSPERLGLLLPKSVVMVGTQCPHSPRRAQSSLLWSSCVFTAASHFLLRRAAGSWTPGCVAGGSGWGGTRRSGDRGWDVGHGERGTELVDIDARAAVGRGVCPLLRRGARSLRREAHRGGGPGARRAGGAAAGTGVPVAVATAPREPRSLAPAGGGAGQRAGGLRAGQAAALRGSRAASGLTLGPEGERDPAKGWAQRAHAPHTPPARFRPAPDSIPGAQR